MKRMRIAWIFSNLILVFISRIKTHLYYDVNRELPIVMFPDLSGDDSMTTSLFNTFIPDREIKSCPRYSDEEGTFSLPRDDIFDIKPSDIKVVMAFGDSVSWPSIDVF